MADGAMICQETRRRIRLAVAAHAYEVHADPIMSDAEFDALALEIDLGRSTANSDMDDWFAANFDPSTAIWVRRHPDIAGLERIYRMLHSLVLTREALRLWVVMP